jgi:Na+-transporting NADH:ubiquinone oxidoreductase subunit NqrC
MAFQKKLKTEHVDTRCKKFSKLVRREAKVKSLKAANNPEARKQLKAMGDVVYNTGRANLQDWYTPNGRKITANA